MARLEYIFPVSLGIMSPCWWSAIGGEDGLGGGRRKGMGETAVVVWTVVIVVWEIGFDGKDAGIESSHARGSGRDNQGGNGLYDGNLQPRIASDCDVGPATSYVWILYASRQDPGKVYDDAVRGCLSVRRLSRLSGLVKSGGGCRFVSIVFYPNQARPGSGF